MFIRLLGGDHHLAHRKWLDATAPQLIDEAGGRRIGEAAALATFRSINQGPVFSDDQVEEGQVRKDAGQVGHLPAGHEDQLAPAALEPPQRLDSVPIHRAVVRQRAVVVGREGEVPHQPILPVELRMMLPFGSGSTPVARMMRIGRSCRR